VTAECHSGEVRGVLRDLSFEGVEIADGAREHRLKPESILHLSAGNGKGV
jgi:hypothetical protein